jgi:sugar lactone lactonase YvrE
MTFRFRFRFALACTALALSAYACSSDPSSTPGTEADGGADGASPDAATSGDDAATGPQDAAVDAADAATGPQCVGNPLTADGGSVDGGVTLDAAVATRILDEATATGFAVPFVDGPQFIDYGGGSLVFSELSSVNPTLVRIQGDGGARTVIRTTTDPNAFAIGNAVRDGVILTTLSQGALNVPPGILQTLPDGGSGGPMLSIGVATEPNDLVVGPKGDLYFTDPQYQLGNIDVPTGLYRRQTDGGVYTVLAPLDRVNGIALSPDASKLYVTITDLKHVLSFDVAANGTIVGEPATIPTTLVESTADAPDGMAVDVGGNLWIAEAAANASQSGRVEVFTPTGGKLGEIPFPSERPTSVAFGGSDDKTLFVTTEKGIWVFSSRCAGIR